MSRKKGNFEGITLLTFMGVRAFLTYSSL